MSRPVTIVHIKTVPWKLLVDCKTLFFLLFQLFDKFVPVVWRFADAVVYTERKFS